MDPEARDVALFGAAATAILGMAAWMRNRIFGRLDELGNEMAELKDEAAADRLERAAERLENAKQYTTKDEMKDCVKTLTDALKSHSKDSAKGFEAVSRKIEKVFDKLDGKKDR